MDLLLPCCTEIAGRGISALCSVGCRPTLGALDWTVSSEGGAADGDVIGWIKRFVELEVASDGLDSGWICCKNDGSLGGVSPSCSTAAAVGSICQWAPVILWGSTYLRQIPSLIQTENPLYLTYHLSKQVLELMIKVETPFPPSSYSAP